MAGKIITNSLLAIGGREPIARLRATLDDAGAWGGDQTSCLVYSPDRVEPGADWGIDALSEEARASMDAADAGQDCLIFTFMSCYAVPTGTFEELARGFPDVRFVWLSYGGLDYPIVSARHEYEGGELKLEEEEQVAREEGDEDSDEGFAVVFPAAGSPDPPAPLLGEIEITYESIPPPRPKPRPRRSKPKKRR